MCEIKNSNYFGIGIAKIHRNIKDSHLPQHVLFLPENTSFRYGTHFLLLS